MLAVVKPTLPLSLSYDHRAVDKIMVAVFMRNLYGQFEYLISGSV